mgnify:CR=1 FL=1
MLSLHEALVEKQLDTIMAMLQDVLAHDRPRIAELEQENANLREILYTEISRTIARIFNVDHQPSKDVPMSPSPAADQPAVQSEMLPNPLISARKWAWEPGP